MSIWFYNGNIHIDLDGQHPDMNRTCLETLSVEVKKMTNKRGSNRGQVAPGVNPQGYGKDVEFSTEPKSELENIAKKSNKK